MSDPPYGIEVLLAIGTSVKKSSLELISRENDLFLTAPRRILLRGNRYKLLDVGRSDMAYLDEKGNPYKLLRYTKD